MGTDTGIGLPGQPLVTLSVLGRPASYSTASTAAWKDAVRSAVSADGVTPPAPPVRYAVSIQFRTPPPLTANEVWDLDNLIKPTLDALEGVFGLRQWAGHPQPADDLVDYLVASKDTVAPPEPPGATIRIHVLQPGEMA